MHQDIYEELKQIARAEKTTTYSLIGGILGLDMGNPAHRNEIAEILDEINYYEKEGNRPMISAVVIRRDSNMPGEGFFAASANLPNGRQARR